MQEQIVEVAMAVPVVTMQRQLKLDISNRSHTILGVTSHQWVPVPQLTMDRKGTLREAIATRHMFALGDTFFLLAMRTMSHPLLGPVLFQRLWEACVQQLLNESLHCLHFIPLKKEGWPDRSVISTALSTTEKECHVGNTAGERNLALSQDADLVGDLSDSKKQKPTTGEMLCTFGDHTFVPMS